MNFIIPFAELFLILGGSELFFFFQPSLSSASYVSSSSGRGIASVKEVLKQ